MDDAVFTGKRLRSVPCLRLVIVFGDAASVHASFHRRDIHSHGYYYDRG